MLTPIRHIALWASALLLSAASTLATPVATFDIDGLFALSPDRPGSNLSVEGSFTGSLQPFDPSTFGTYTLTASGITLNSFSLPDTAFALPGTTFTAIIGNPVGAVFAALDTGPGSPYFALNRLTTNPQVTTVFDVDFTSRLPAALAGGFDGTLTAPFPLDRVFEQLLADLDPQNLLFPSRLDIPDDASGRFAATFDVSFEPTALAVVPLPATLPLLGAGVLGLIYLRRRRR